MALYATGVWAAELIASSGSTDFQLPADYKPNPKDSPERRDHKEAVFREQWAAAVACTNKWRWLCASCVTTLGAALIGADVMVWWHDDTQAYRGCIDAYDEASQCHRVMYQDQEWEFVNLAIEPIAFGSAEDFVLPTPTRRRK